MDFFAILLFVAVAAVAFVVANSVAIVGGTELAVLERRWFGKPMPDGRVVAMSNEVGIQARILGPGLHLLTPFLYRVKKHPMVEIDENSVGLVESVDGLPTEAGRIFARMVSGHNIFQDGEAFLAAGGEKGPQIQVLPAGVYRINPHLFRVQKVPVVRVPNNQIGLIVAMDGKPIAPGRLLGARVEAHDNYQNGQAFLEKNGQKGPQIDILLPGNYRVNTKLFQVELRPATMIPALKLGLITARDGEQLPAIEYVARGVEGSREFQDAAAFLSRGGQRGPQFDFLRPGTYYINPLMFDVRLDDVLQVQRGEVAVVVSNVGKDPADLIRTADAIAEPPAPEERLKLGVERYVVEPGYRGIQREVLGPGTYNINRLAFTPHIIPTTNITIDWAEGKNENNERIFDPLAIVSKDGFEMTISVKVIIRVLPNQAPHMVARIGTIENLINHVIHPLIDSSFRNQASSTEAMRFMQDRHEQQKGAEVHIAEELKRYHVECVSVLICQIVLPERLMETLTNKVVAFQQKSMFDSQREAEERRREMEKTKAEANLQPSLVKAEIDVQIANQQKQQAVILAEGKGQSTRLEQEGIAAGVAAVGRAEGEKIRAVGEATAASYLSQAQALGQGPLATIELMKQVAGGKLKITPDILIQGGGDGSGGSSHVLSAFIASLMAERLAGKEAPAAPKPPAALAPGNGS